MNSAQYAPVRWVRASERECAWAEPSVCCVSCGPSTSLAGGSSSTLPVAIVVIKISPSIAVVSLLVFRFSFISFFTSPMEGRGSYEYETATTTEEEEQQQQNKHPTCVCVCHADSTHLWLTYFLYFILKEIKEKKRRHAQLVKSGEGASCCKFVEKSFLVLEFDKKMNKFLEK